MNAIVKVSIGNRPQTAQIVPVRSSKHKNDLSIDKIQVTQHALSRFCTRFKFMLHKDILGNVGSARYMMRKFLSEARSCDFALKQRVGTYNAICAHYKAKVDYFEYKNKMVFVTTKNNTGHTVILTVCRSPMVIAGVVL